MFRLLLPCLLCLWSALPATGAVFLHLDGIPGESSDARHAGWIAVESFSSGVARAASTNRPTFEPIRIGKRIDRATPTLFLRAADARKITNAVLEVVRPGETAHRFLRVRMRGVTVLSFRQSGIDDAPPTDAIAFDFETVEWTYTQFDARNRPLRDITCAWNRLTGVGKGGNMPPDRDNDGMPDDYEELYGLDPDVNDADDDLDKDGVSNIDEFRAGTRPDLKDSVLRVAGQRSAAGVVTLNWERAPERGYRLLAAPTPAGPFEFVRRLEPSEDPEGVLEIPATGPDQFFILEVE